MDAVAQKIFVFVVCGAKLHTDTLNFSLPFLQRRTAHRIVVVTDLSRNEGKIDHLDILDVKTPKEYNNHQACIYLKTGLHLFLPKGNNYCYLDSDVLALGEKVDRIFDEYIPPIRFAADRSTLNYFSPYAVNCGCQESFDKRMQDRINRIAWFHKTIADIETTVARSKKSWSYFLREWQYKLPSKYYRLNRKYRMEKQTGLWYLNDGRRMVLEDFDEMFEYECKHLHKKLSADFQLGNIPENWNHWNGGVFLFNDASNAFMDKWHRLSLAFFTDKEWKIRDQASLVVTIWQMGLQEQPVLPAKWNFLWDYDKGEIRYGDNGETLLYDGKLLELPEFAHIYRYFGDETWDVWNFLTQNG